MEPSTTEPTVLSSEHFYFALKEIAERFGNLRWLTRLVSDAERLRGMHDNDEDRLNDWLDACAFMALKVLEGNEIRLTQIETASYPFLEDAWLKRVKQLKAYYIWKHAGRGTAEQDFHAASNEIRHNLLTRPRADLRDFQPIKAYLEEKYLDERGKLDDSKHGMQSLIERKSRRIWEIKGDSDPNPQIARDLNWFRAKSYVTMFYENIIPAVVEDDRQSIMNVLRAFEFSKAPQNRYLIINSFEVAIAIYFLNKATLNDVLSRPDDYDFSIVEVDDWPQAFMIPSSCGRRFRYDEIDKQIIYEGRMAADQKHALVALLLDEKHRSAVEQLFQQSQLQPFEEQVL